MKTRKMWAFSNWPNRRWVGCSEHTAVGRVPVLLTSLEGAPDFEPGDRVRYRNENCEVIGHPFPRHELWLLPILWNCGYELVAHDMVTKLPREKKVTYTVTGEPDEVQRWEADNGIGARSYRVRVERVEDPDE